MNLKHVSDWLVTVAAIVASASAIIFTLRKAASWVNRTMKRLNAFLDDWARTGGLAGIQERIDRTDQRVGAIEEIITRQLTNNGGYSLADQVSQVHRAVGAGTEPVVRRSETES